MKPLCVARYLVEIDTVLCGNPDIPWVNDSDIMSKEERMKRTEQGLCSWCESLDTALNRAIHARAMRGQRNEKG